MWITVIMSAASFGTIGALMGERRGAKGSGAVCGLLLGPIGQLLLVLGTDLVPSDPRLRQAAAGGALAPPDAMPAAATAYGSAGRAPRFTSAADLRAIRKAARGHGEADQGPGDGTSHA